jgi:uncharacterized membrane protein YfcA
LENLHYFILLALAAEILGTVGGFGSSLFFVPIAAYFLDFHSVLGITALFHVTSNLSKIALFKEGVEKKIIIQIGIPAVVFVVIGAYLSKFIETRILEIALSLFLISISLTLLLFRNISLQPNLLNSVGGGALSGLLAGLVGTGGAIRGITLATFQLKMKAFIATSAFIDLGIDLSRSVVYSLNGFVHKDDLYLLPILFVVSIVGTYAGKKILTRISETRFKSIVLVLVLLTGLTTLTNIVYK